VYNIQEMNKIKKIIICTPTIKTGTGEINWWILTLVALMNSLKVSLLKYLLIIVNILTYVHRMLNTSPSRNCSFNFPFLDGPLDIGTWKNCYFAMGKCGRYFPNLITKVNNIRYKTGWYFFAMIWWERHIISVKSFPTIYNPVIIRKNQTKSIWGTFYKMSHRYFQHCPGHQKQGKAEELSWIWGD
jgi:hypothetical protein